MPLCVKHIRMKRRHKELLPSSRPKILSIQILLGHLSGHCPKSYVVFQILSFMTVWIKPHLPCSTFICTGLVFSWVYPWHYCSCSSPGISHPLCLQCYSNMQHHTHLIWNPRTEFSSWALVWINLHVSIACGWDNLCVRNPPHMKPCSWQSTPVLGVGCWLWRGWWLSDWQPGRISAAPEDQGLCFLLFSFHFL